MLARIIVNSIPDFHKDMRFRVPKGLYEENFSIIHILDLKSTEYVTYGFDDFLDYLLEIEGYLRLHE